MALSNLPLQSQRTMTYKHNESRHKSHYKVRSWRDYNNGLPKRGDVTFWFTEKAIA
jgi:hypothetical protein